MIIITDGKAQDAEDIPAIARKLRSKVTKVIAVGIGKADQAELELIATRPFDENVIYIGEFGSLLNLVLRLASSVSTFFMISDFNFNFNFNFIGYDVGSIDAYVILESQKSLTCRHVLFVTMSTNAKKTMAAVTLSVSTLLMPFTASAMKDFKLASTV